MKSFGLSAAFVCLAFAGDPVVHRLPIASSVFPMGAQPGAEFDAEILGEHLDRTERILFHDTGVEATVLEAAPTQLRVRFKVDKKASWGQHAFHVVNPRGASAPLLLRISDQPRVLEKEPNSKAGTAQTVPIPATVMGRLPVDGDFDFYRIRVEKNSRWVFDLRSARNGNSLDAALFLLDAKGRKIDYDEEHFIWDPFLVHEFAEAGDYLLVVQPTHVRNDPNFAYELDIRQSPHLDTVVPLSIAPGVEQEITILGAALYGSATIEGAEGSVISMEGTSARAKIRVPADTPAGPMTLTLVSPGGRSNPVELLVDPTPRHPGGERITAPVSIPGIAKYRQPDVYKFKAKAGDTLVFEVRGQRFGSPVDLTMRLLDASGKQVAQNDDFTFAGGKFYQRDPRLMHTFKEEGEYAVELRNTVQVPGERAPYQLVVRPPQPSYVLQLADERPHVPAGGSAKWKITAQRLDGHKDPIPLTLTGLPAGVTAGPAEIPEGKDEAYFELQASGKPGEASLVTVRGGSEEAWRSVRVSSGGGEGATFARVNKAIVTISEKPNFSLEAQATSVNVPRGGTAVIPVSIRREKDFGGAIRFEILNLPAGVVLEPLTVQAGAERADLQIRATGEAPLGRSPRVAILGIAGGETQEAPRITVQVD